MEARDEGRGMEVRAGERTGGGFKKKKIGGYGCMKTNDAKLSGH